MTISLVGSASMAEPAGPQTWGRSSRSRTALSAVASATAIGPIMQAATAVQAINPKRMNPLPQSG